MTAYIYVLAINAPEGIRFHHRVVMAGSDTDAYRIGANLAMKAGLLPITAPGESANDYVIQLVAE